MDSRPDRRHHLAQPGLGRRASPQDTDHDDEGGNAKRHGESVQDAVVVALDRRHVGAEGIADAERYAVQITAEIPAPRTKSRSRIPSSPVPTVVPMRTNGTAAAR